MSVVTAVHDAEVLSLRPSADHDLWDEFVSGHPDGTPFHRADFLTTIGSVLGLEVHLAVAEAAGAVRGVVPMLVRNRGPVLRVNRGLPVPYVGPLLAPGHSLDEALGAVRRYLRPRVIAAYDVQSVTPFLPPDQSGWSYDNSYSSAFCPVPGTDDEGLLNTLAKTQRAHARRSVRRGLVSGPATRQEVADHLTAWANAPLLRQGLPPRWPVGSHLAVYDALPREVCLATAVRRDGEPLAVGLALCFAGRMVGWEVGMSEEGRSAGAGTLLHVAELALARDRGIAELDILGAPSPSLENYKRSLGAEFRSRGVASWDAPVVGGLRLARRATSLAPTRGIR
ncbi:GNAT family N-acetyltransferase [Blastococcus sp. SYSU DS0973]